MQGHADGSFSWKLTCEGEGKASVEVRCPMGKTLFAAKGAAVVLKEELEGFHKRCPDKPIVIMEYGADTIAGFHSMAPRMFSEEYQTEYLKTYSDVFDSLPYMAGEHVWNFYGFCHRRKRAPRKRQQERNLHKGETAQIGCVLPEGPLDKDVMPQAAFPFI